MYWDMCLGGLIMYSVLVIPIRIGFEMEVDVPNSWQFIFDCFIDVTFLADMMLNFHTGFYDDQEEFIVDKRVIAGNYLRGWFFIDLVSTVPIDLFVELAVGGGGGLRAIKMVRMVRLLKLARLKKLAKIMRTVEESININPSLLKLVRLLSYILLLAHFLGCFWFFVGTGSAPDRKWITSYGVEGTSLATKYATSLYWAVATMTAVGYGDVVALDDGERMYSIVTQLIGASVFGFLIGNIATLLETIDLKGSRFKRHKDRVVAYMAVRMVPRDLQKKVRRHIEYYLAQTSVFPEYNILMKLSVPLRNQIMFQAYRDVIEDIDFFEDMDPSFVSALILKWMPFSCPAGKAIAKEGEHGDEMYFLRRGTIHILKHIPGAPQKHLLAIQTPGSCVGEHAVLTSKPWSATILCSTYCELFSIKKYEVDNLIKYFPAAGERIRDIASQKMKALQEVTAAEAAARRLEDSVRDGETEFIMVDSEVKKRSDIGHTLMDAEYKSRVTLLRTRRSSVHGLVPGSEPGSRRTSGLGALLPFQQIAEVEDVQESDRDLLRRLIFRPDGKFKTRWDVALTVAILYSVIIIPYRIFFDVGARGGWLYWDYCIDVFFGLDLFVNFRTGYFEEPDQVLVTMSGAIAKKYVKSGWFFVDFFSTLPIDMIVGAFLTDGNDPDTLRSIKLIRILRLARLAKLMRLSKFTALLEEEYMVNPIILSFMKLFLQVTFIAHIMSCCWYFVSDMGGAGRCEGGYDCNWIYYQDPMKEGRTSGSFYIAALYWSFTTMTTVGYGDITPGTNAEKGFAIFSMFVGVTVFGYIVGSMASLVGKLNEAEYILRSKMEELNEYLTDKGVSREMVLNVKRYYEQKILSETVFEEESILAEFPSYIRKEILMHNNKDALGMIRLFPKLDLKQIMKIVSLTNIEQVGVGSICFGEGEPADRMMLLLSGRAQISQRRVMGKSLSFKQGDFAGEWALFVKSTYAKTVSMIERGTVAYLHRQSYQYLCGTREEIGLELDFQLRKHLGAEPRAEESGGDIVLVNPEDRKRVCAEEALKFRDYSAGRSSPEGDACFTPDRESHAVEEESPAPERKLKPKKLTLPTKVSFAPTEQRVERVHPEGEENSAEERSAEEGAAAPGGRPGGGVSEP